MSAYAQGGYGAAWWHRFPFYTWWVRRVRALKGRRSGAPPIPPAAGVGGARFIRPMTEEPAGRDWPWRAIPGVPSGRKRFLFGIPGLKPRPLYGRAFGTLWCSASAPEGYGAAGWRCWWVASFGPESAPAVGGWHQMPRCHPQSVGGTKCLGVGGWHRLARNPHPQSVGGTE